MSDVKRFTTQDVADVLDMAIDLGVINSDQRASLAGIFIGRDMANNPSPELQSYIDRVKSNAHKRSS